MHLNLPDRIIVYKPEFPKRIIRESLIKSQTLKQFVFSYLKDQESIGYQASYKVEENLLTKSVLILLKYIFIYFFKQ